MGKFSSIRDLGPMSPEENGRVSSVVLSAWSRLKKEKPELQNPNGTWPSWLVDSAFEEGVAALKTMRAEHHG